MQKLAVIGAGQLGSRHLQALIKIQFPAMLETVDPSQQSLNMAMKRASEIPCNKNIKEIKFHSSLASLSSEIDLCIIATTSKIRAKVTKELLRNKKVKCILFEKVLFQTVSDYEEISRLLNKNKIKAWVNCPRRIYSFYQDIKRQLSQEEKLIFIMYGGEWGLACNSIHLIDILAFLTENSDYRLDAEWLDSDVIESKRKDYVELTGTLRGHFSNGSELILYSYRGSQAPNVINICGRNIEIIIDEGNGIAKISKESKNWKWEEITFCIPFQSDLTQIVANDIIENGKCNLTTFEESVKLHLPLINSINKHLECIWGKKVEHCPIT